MPPPKLKVGLAGLGRMGKRHAMHFLNRTPRAELVAASTPDTTELGWARERLEPWGVTPYRSYEQMLNHPGLQAVVVASATSVHADQAIKAMTAHKHVLCEKPLSTSVEVSQSVLTAARSHPHLKVMCGFSRRFDASYRDAYRKTLSGLIGTPCVFRSQTCDKLDPSGFFVAYSKHSGGIFVDCSIHDIDLAFWFFGEATKVKSVVASGITAVEPGLKEWGDADNAVGIVEFHGGKVAYFYASRMMAAGQEDSTEVVGTKGKLTVNMQPQLNLVSHHGQEGARRELPMTYYERFEDAFVREANEFTDVCLDGGEVPVGLRGAVEAVRIGSALQESLRTGEKIWFGEDGERVIKAR
ncbi:MAG: hypothetical protein LQ352_002227 [Teloschistes flavicans]|nr:MAG: hypothetical protein LQ352_002227 [Teloschistes flavicans]